MTVFLVLIIKIATPFSLDYEEMGQRKLTFLARKDMFDIGFESADAENNKPRSKFSHTAFFFCERSSHHL